MEEKILETEEWKCLKKRPTMELQIAIFVAIVLAALTITFFNSIFQIF